VRYPIRWPLSLPNAGALFRARVVRIACLTEAVKALSWKQTRGIVDLFTTLNPYNLAIVPGAILNIVEDINCDSAGNQRQVCAYGILPSVTPCTHMTTQE
jgi:hypothetical protein